MNKLLIVLFCLILNSGISSAFNYTEEDKSMFYDAFIEGYIEKMTKDINSLDIEQEKKDKFLKEFVQNINKNELINSSWSCIKKYPINDIVQASITCTKDWSTEQAEKNKKLFEAVK